MSRETSETDASSATSRKFPEVKSTSGSTMSTSKDSDYYDMAHKKRGKAIIFNHLYFDDPKLTARNSSEMDALRLESTFEYLNFDVDRYDDLKYSQIYDVISETAAEDHTDHDCLVIVVMTHGGSGTLHAWDQNYPADSLWLPFAGNECPSLAGKPKLFFVQACRGDKTDEGVTIKHDAGNDQTYILPAMADFLIMYASVEEYKAFRSPTNGSWFIEALCSELRTRARDQDLLTILTFVNRNVATNYESKNGYKQVGSIVSSLTRILHFFPNKY